MRFSPFTIDEVASTREALKTITFKGPEGQQDIIGDLEVLLVVHGATTEAAYPELMVKVELETGDLEALQENGCFYIGLLGSSVAPMRVLHQEQGGANGG